MKRSTETDNPFRERGCLRYDAARVTGTFPRPWQENEFTMPLRDHFRPPLKSRSSWEAIHGGWPMMIVSELNSALPQNYVAEPRVHLGTQVEIDIAAFERDGESETLPHWIGGNSGGAVATATWSPPQATLSVPADLPAQDEYEVRVYDMGQGRRLVAAIEIVSPANKDRPEHRRAFVSKCSAMLQQQVSVVIVDLVTTRQFNLYHDLLEQANATDPAFGDSPQSIYVAVCKSTRPHRVWTLDAWYHPLTLGTPLPTVPLWLADDYSIPLNLESSYEETCRVLRLPPVA